MKHTPGPWRFSQAQDGKWYAYGADSKPVYVENVSATNRPKAERMANAQLIAATPDLLEAAELTVLHFKRNQVSGNFQGDDEHEAWTALSNAIRKAKGETA